MDSWECKKKFTRKYFKKKLQIKKTHEEKLTDQTQTHRPSGVNEERSERSGSRKKKGQPRFNNYKRMDTL